MHAEAPRKARSMAALARRWRRPFDEFVRQESVGGLLLLFSALLALLWANSALSSSYEDTWLTPIRVGLADWQLEKTARNWINDGLMAVFFFVVGLEIKREVVAGELAQPRRAAFPLVAAMGGMLFPAAAFLALNLGGPGERGWGIPMATDIAFALGILSLLGKRASTSTKLFLTALAIADDLGAVLVIALFYTSKLASGGLLLSGAFLTMLILSNRAGYRHPVIYAVLGVGLWFGVLNSGIHATVAGVLLALTIPARPSLQRAEFIVLTREVLNRFEQEAQPAGIPMSAKEQYAALQTLESACQRMESPLQRLEHALHPWVTYAVLPIFALANAGVTLERGSGSLLSDPITLGIVAGLVIGKPVGILASCWLFVRSGAGRLPEGISWRDVLGVGLLAGVGFTMSVFIASLAFQAPGVLDVAKIGILAGSLTAGVLGWAVFRTRPFYGGAAGE